MNKYKTPIRAIALACALTTAFQIQAQAEQLYYFGFENSLVNEGSLGGTATKTGSPTASTTQGTPVGLGSSYAEYFSTSSATLALPSSTDVLRMDSLTSNMTVSLWMYIEGDTQKWIDFLSTKGTGTGWYLSVGDSSKSGALRAATNTQPTASERYATGSVPLQSWVNIVVEMSTANLANGEWKAFLDGVDVLNTKGGVAPTNQNSILLKGGSNPVYYDDLAIWDTTLGTGKARALSTAPTTLATENAYNAGVMDDLFNLYDAGTGSLTVNTLTWAYSSGFDTTGHVLGDTWTTGDTNYIWLGGSAGAATGVATVPEPATWAMLSAGGLLVFLQRLRRRTQQLS